MSQQIELNPQTTNTAHEGAIIASLYRQQV